MTPSSGVSAQAVHRYWDGMEPFPPVGEGEEGRGGEDGRERGEGGGKWKEGREEGKEDGREGSQGGKLPEVIIQS